MKGTWQSLKYLNVIQQSNKIFNCAQKIYFYYKDMYVGNRSYH